MRNYLKILKKKWEIWKPQRKNEKFKILKKTIRNLKDIKKKNDIFKK